MKPLKRVKAISSNAFFSGRSILFSPVVHLTGGPEGSKVAAVLLCVCLCVKERERERRVFPPVHSLNLCWLTSHLERKICLNSLVLKDLLMNIIRRMWKNSKSTRPEKAGLLSVHPFKKLKNVKMHERCFLNESNKSI